MNYRLTCKTASAETCREVGTRESVKGDYRKTYSKINKNTAYKSFNLQHTHISDSPLGKPQIPHVSHTPTPLKIVRLRNRVLIPITSSHK